MRQNNYFDYDGNIKSFNILPVDLISSLFSKKEMPQIDDATEDFFESSSSQPEPSEPLIEAPKPALKNRQRSIEDIENEPKANNESDILEAIRAFSHKSGDMAVTPAYLKPADRIKNVARTVREKNPIEVIERVSRGKRFFITTALLILTIIIFAGMIGVFMMSINRENERINDFNLKAGEVCSDYITKYGSANYENLYSNYGVEGYRLTGLCFARELDFNGDGESELMVCYSKNGVYYNEVWGYSSSNDFTMLFSEKAAQSEEDVSQDAWSTLYYKNNKYFIGVHDESDITKVDLYQMRGNRFTKKLSCTYDPEKEEYIVDEEADNVSFERIKFSVLRVEKASVSAEAAAKTIEGFTGTQTDAAQPGMGQSLENAYYSVVQEYNRKYGTSQFVEENGVAYLDGLAVVDLIDFDGDSQNELLLVYRKEIKVNDDTKIGNSAVIAKDEYFCDIYRYSGSRAVIAYSNEGLSNVLNNSEDRYFMLRNRGNLVDYCVNNATSSNYGREINASSAAYEFNGTEFTSCFDASYKTEYNYTQYYLDGETVQKTKFDSECSAIPLFVSDGDYDTKKYTVTYVQRKASDKGDMESIISQTEKNIQKLNPQYTADAAQEK